VKIRHKYNTDQTRLIATGDTYAIRDFLKKRGYRWNHPTAPNAWSVVKPPPIPDAKHFRAKRLYADQQRILKLLLTERPYVALNWGLGTGKTRIGIAWNDNLPQNVPSVTLIMCPKNTINVWREEFLKWTLPSANARFVAAPQSTAETLKIIDNIRNSGQSRTLLIVNYSKLAKIVDALLTLPITMIIADESQYLKNPRSQRSRAVWKLRDCTPYKILQSGTLITKTPDDLWNQMFFLTPPNSIFPAKHQKFLDEFSLLGFDGYTRIFDTHKISEAVALVVDYVTANHAFEILPDQTHWVYMTKSEKRDYDAIDEPYLLSEYTKKSMLTATCVERIARIESIITATDDQIIVWAHHKNLLNEIEQLCIRNKISYAMIDGRHHNYGDVTEWKQGKRRILIASTMSAAEGQNFQNCRYNVFAEPSWRYDHWEQAHGRIARGGQLRNVINFYVYVKNSLDAEVLMALETKTDFQSVISK